MTNKYYAKHLFSDYMKATGQLHLFKDCKILQKNNDLSYSTCSDHNLVKYKKKENWIETL